MAGELEFLCKDFSVEESLDETPRLSIKMVATNRSNKDLYIPPLSFDVKLLAIPSKSWASSYKEEGQLEVPKSEPMFIEKEKGKTVEICIPINSQRLERMLNIRYGGNLIGFDVFVKGLAFPCLPISTSDEIAFRWPKTIADKVMYNLPAQMIDRIVMTSEQFDNIIEKLKHYELLRFEIPVREPKNAGQKDLNEAIKLLHSAKDNLIHGEYKDAMLDIRNALLNHLLEEKQGSAQTNKEKVLKLNIREALIENVPTEAKDTYGEVITNLDNILRGVRHTLSGFIHEDSDKLKRAPLRQDVELAYFLTTFVVKYLAIR